MIFKLFILSFSYCTALQILPYTHFVKNSLPSLKISNKFQGFNELKDEINILPTKQTNILVDNWINYHSLYNLHHAEQLPEFMFKTIFDFKHFISKNEVNSKTLYMAWCPVLPSNNVIVYLVACTISNDSLNIYRIIQNPQYNKILNIDSKDFRDKLKEFNRLVVKKKYISYKELHKYDPRFKLSWTLF